jgi:para-aminobenzoate synthetase component I
VTPRPRCKAIIESIELSASPEAVAALTANALNPAVLETLQPANIAGRYSIYAADPIELFTIEAPVEGSLAAFTERVNHYPALNGHLHELPFVGGWIGCISYEAGVPGPLVDARLGELEFPLLRFGLYDHALIFDHREKRWWATAIEWNGFDRSHPSASARLRNLRKRIEKAGRLTLPELACPEHSLAMGALTRDQYDARVVRIKRYIEAGDIYQANLAQRFTIESQAPPFDLYRRVRAENPASYAAFISWDDKSIISASPELFLELRGDRVVTRPIKGTRPRSGVESIDASTRRDLETSLKEQSELNMIIDLLRNDLGRVCEYGTIRVSASGEIEAHPTVFHRVATIEGRLACGKNWSHLLQATFPGGSIIGAPKIRAMQIIRELEPFARGAYCGAIGWIGLDGNMTLSIAIRTVVCRDGMINLYAGGAIVADSQAQAEYEEILAKAGGLLSSLNAVPAAKGELRGHEVGAS